MVLKTIKKTKTELELEITGEDETILHPITRYSQTMSCYLPAYEEIEKQAARFLMDKKEVDAISFMTQEKFRLVVEGPPNWTSFRELWRMFSSEGAVVVASTYTKVGGVYDDGFRHDPDHPLETLADYCLGCYTNHNLENRTAMLARYVRDYRADGFMINSIMSCDSFSAGQLLILREVERRTGKPGGFFESDLVDPRYFSAANIKNRIECAGCLRR